jgi:mycothiol synthase
VVEVRVVQPVAPADVVAITRLHDNAEAADGHPSLGEAVWRDLDQRDPDAAGLLAVEPATDRLAGYAHVYRSDSFSPPHWAVGLLVHPEQRRGDTAERLLATAVDHVSRHGGGPLVLWVVEPDAPTRDAVARTGFRHQRDLLQQRVPLPIDEMPVWPAGTTLRSFVPGRDEAAWLEVNNRAFQNHLEQGGWVESTLRRRMAEPWFDPNGFLLAFDREGLAGFCWTKVHPAGPFDDSEPLGEIFVIGVDPSRQGSGLGRALTVAGLASLYERGVPTGMLYVDAANQPALRMYESLGFETHRVDRAYAQDVLAK